MKAVRVLVGILLLLAIVVLAAIIATRKSSRLEVVQSDGSITRIEAITYGKTHQFITGKRWQALLRKYAPFTGRFLPLGAVLPINTTTENDAFVFWITRFDAKRGKYVNDFTTLVLEDEHGCRFAGNDAGGSWNGKFNVRYLRFEGFPRRQAKFRIRLYAADGDETVFEIKNPARGPFPKWTPEQLPATRSDGAWAVTLNGLRNQGSDIYPFTPDFSVRCNGEPTKDFEYIIQVSDATGNSTMTGALCTNEPAWKLTGWFWRRAQASFAEGEIWRLSKMHMPTNGEGITINRSTTLDGVRLKLLAFGGSGSFDISNGVFVAASATVTNVGTDLHTGTAAGGGPYIHAHIVRSTPFLLVQANGLTNGQRLLIRAMDTNGSAIGAEESKSSAELRTYGFLKAVMPEELTLEFIIHKPYRAEFIIKPPMVETATPTPESSRQTFK